MTIKERTEYHFSDLEDFDEVAAASSTSTSRPSESPVLTRLKAFWYGNKRVLIISGVLLLIILLVKGFGSSSKTISKKPVTTQTPSAMTLETELKSALTEMNRNNKAALDGVEKKLGEMESKVAALQFQLDAASYSLRDMTQQLTQFIQESEEKTKKNKVSTGSKKVKLPLYYIKAMVPGRVWLSSNGASTSTATTVVVGDTLPGYGVVTAIDVNTGTLVTDQGKRITYRPNDR